MSVYSHVDGLGPRIEEALADSILTWRDEHVKSRHHVDVLAQALSSVTIEVTLFPQGYASAAVTVRAKHRHDDSWQLFRFNRVGSGEWKLTASSLR